jgi:hypothetical protein
MLTLQNIYFLWKKFVASKSLSFREFFEHIEPLHFQLSLHKYCDKFILNIFLFQPTIIIWYLVFPAEMRGELLIYRNLPKNVNSCTESLR